MAACMCVFLTRISQGYKAISRLKFCVKAVLLLNFLLIEKKGLSFWYTCMHTKSSLEVNALETLIGTLTKDDNDAGYEYIV